jgi:hypothetical protein
MSFEAYFEGLKQEGTLDSTGIFTLNADKLKGKLAQYQLANPREYAQFLVRAACAGSARRIRSQFTPKRSVIEIEGLYFEMDQLQQFSFQRPESGAEEAAHYVAVALSAADRLGDVEILVGREGKGFRIASKSGELSFHNNDPNASQLDGTLFEVTGDLQENPAHKLTPSARWSPVPHRPDHFSIDGSDFFGQLLIAAAGPKFQFASRLDKLPIATTYTEEEARDLILLFWVKGLANPQVLGVHRGISYPMPDITLPRGLIAVVRADDLKPDISYGGLVQNEAYKAKGKMLRRLVFNLLEKIVAAPVRWSENDIELILSKLALYWPRKHQTPELLKFYERRLATMLPKKLNEVESFLKQAKELSVDLEQCLTPYRMTISELRWLNIAEARKLLHVETAVRQKLELQTTEFLDRKALFSQVYDDQWPHHVRFRELRTVPNVSELLRNRADPTESDLRNIGVTKPWLDLLLFQLWLENGEDRKIERLLLLPHPPILSLIHALRLGHAELALKWIEQTPEHSSIKKYWQAVILEFLRGGLSWPAQIKMRARSSFGLNFEESLLLKKAQEPDLREQLYQTHIFSQHFWPLAAFAALRAIREGESIVKDWLRIYLQTLLGQPGSSATIAELEEAPVKLPLVGKDPTR